MMASRSRRSAETFCQIQSPSPREAASRSRNRESSICQFLHRFRIEPRELLLQPVAAHEDGGAVRGFQRQELAVVLDPARVGRLPATDRRQRVALLDHDVGEEGIRPAPDARLVACSTAGSGFSAAARSPASARTGINRAGFFWVGSDMGGSGVDRDDDVRDAIPGSFGVARAIEAIVRDELLADMSLIGAERRRLAFQQPRQVPSEHGPRRIPLAGLDQRHE